jgi:hypothetical protein
MSGYTEGAAPRQVNAQGCAVRGLGVLGVVLTCVTVKSRICLGVLGIPSPVASPVFPLGALGQV